MKYLDLLGWTATAVFSASYFTRKSKTLRWVQAGAALIWIAYGVMLHAIPVVVANCIVAIASIGSSFTGTMRLRRPPRKPLSYFQN
jgi:hypothetical protein